MSGENVGIVRLGGTLLVFTTPLPAGSMGGLRFDAGVDIYGGDGHFVVDDRWADLTSPDYPTRRAAIVRHVWYTLHDRGVVPDSEPPPVVDGDPRRMLEAPAV